MLLNYLTATTMVSSVVCQDWAELVDTAGAPLVADGSVTNQYLDSIKDTVRRFGSYMVLVDGVALLHGRPEAKVNRVALSLATLSEPVSLLDKPVNAAFVLAATDNDSHIDLMRDLAKALGDSQFLELLRQDASQDEITQRLVQLEEQHESD